ncbi:hypothetical protein RPYSC3_32060 [Rhodopseudomonas palustris]|nr:hypothetical protein RPYSC3_32060 [Rhodopseudomonas palustris]
MFPLREIVRFDAGAALESVSSASSAKSPAAL